MPDRKEELKAARANARPVKPPAAAADKAIAASADRIRKPAKQRAPKNWIRVDPPTLPDDCPVLCLGRDARRYAFIDSNGGFLVIEVNQMSADGIVDLFARRSAMEWLWHNFPKFDKTGLQIGWDKEKIKIALMMECAAKGPFNFEQRVRGEGAWHDDEGRLHWHLGDTVLVAEKDQLPRYENSVLVHGYVYPRGARQPRPVEQRDTTGTAIKLLFATLCRWHWHREKDAPELDARMLLGWLGCAIIGGALGWRSTLWLRGPRGAGKSTLLLLLYLVLGGDGSAIKATDASAAGITSALRHRSIAVMVDEAEPRRGDNRHVENCVALARASSSGAVTLRASSNLESRSYTARSCFFFSSINVPGDLTTADLTRIVMLRIMAIVKGKGELDVQGMRGDLAEAGAQIRRLLVDAWPVWPKILAAWREQLMFKHGLEARIADTWGTVLAMQDLLLNVEERLVDGEVPTVELEKWCAPIALEVGDMLEERGTDHDKVLRHLMTSTIEGYSRGQRYTFETLMAVAAGWAIPGDVESALGGKDSDMMQPHRANSFLVKEGFKVLKATPPATKDEKPKEALYLACHKDHRGAKALFEDTDYKNNGHLQQLEQVPGAYHSRQRFAAGKRQPAIMVPIAYLLDDLAPAPLGASSSSSPRTPPPTGEEPPPPTMEPG